MKKIAVIGTPERYEELQKLGLPAGVKVEFFDQMQIEMNELREELISSGYGDDPGDEDLDLMGMDDQLDELNERLSNVDWEEFDLVIDLNLDENPTNLLDYADVEGLVVLGCAVRQSLAAITRDTYAGLGCKIIGINALPTMLARPVVEVSLLEPGDKPVLDKLMYELDWKFELVDDRVGMVTPRIVCMIINEAGFLVGEGTSNIQGVDQAMRLGTNYPMGPFEWADAIGINNVYAVLYALGTDSGEEKYKIAPLLKKHFLKEKLFYPLSPVQVI
jgi:3-hydroxybutyryl-CoA dehydrogenase